jgi:predicted permease
VKSHEAVTALVPRQAAAYRRLLWLLPDPQVRDHADDMVALFCHHLVSVSGSRRAMFGVWLGALRDLARHGPRFPRRAVGAPGPRRSPQKDLTMTERLQLLISNLRRDVAYGTRLLRRDWTFTLAATLILGLAIGANTAVFSFVDTYLLRPLPYPDAERLALASRQYSKGGAMNSGQDGRTWEGIRDAASDEFQAAVYSGWGTDANLATGSTARTVALQRVGAGYFSTLGVAPLIGREFTAAEDVPDGSAVTVLSHQLWQQLFEGDRDAIGSSVLLRGEPHTVVGVMPANFRTSASADLWVPLRPSTSGEGGGINYLILLRLAPGTTWAQADAELNAIGLGVNEQIQEERRFTLSLQSLQAGDTGMMRMMLTLLSAAVGMVLLIACVNVSGLLLARGSRRGREIATRMAIGGGRAAIVRQFVVESVVLAVVGGAAGLLFAQGFVRAITTLASGVLDTWRPVELDTRVLAGTALISLGTALVFGLAPAFQASRVSINDALRSAGGRGVAGGSRNWRRVLVVAEVSLCVVLLVAAGLLLRTFLHLQGLSPGFDPQGIVTVSVSLQDARYATRQSAEQLFEAGLERVRALPGTISASAALGLPYDRLLNTGFDPIDFELEAGQSQITNLVYVSPEYFETLGVPIVEGRGVDASDAHDAAPVAVVNETFASTYLPPGSVLGRTFATAGADRQVVGMVSTVKQRGSWGNAGPVDETPTVYVPVSQVSGDFLKTVHTWFAPAWIIRVAGDPGDAARNIETALASVDPLLPLGSTRFAADLQADALSLQRFTATLVGILAAAAVILAGLGIYGLVASTVAERRREIGIRLALGAHPGHAIRIAAMPSIRLATIGAVLGIGGSFAASNSLRSLLWGVAPNDPWTYVGVSIALVVAAALASLIPATRAARVDPANTLRVE